MRYTSFSFVFTMFYFMCNINHIESTCVFDSDFGFILNCNFKKSSLFRVRNLGGVKAHIGLGFSVGDELGLPESLGNLEANKRRSLNLRTAPNNIGVLPASKMSTSQQLQPQPIQRNMPKALTSRPAMAVSSQRMTLAKPTMNTPLYSPRPKVSAKALMTQASSLPLGVPAFKRLPAAETQMKIVPSPQIVERTSITMLNTTLTGPTRLQQIYDSQKINEMMYANAQTVPPFQGMPESVARISTGPVVETSDNRPEAHHLIDKPTTQIQALPQFDLRGHTLEELAAAANVNVTTIKAAIEMRQRQLLEKQEQETMFMQQLQRQQQHLMATQTTRTTTTTTTTTRRPSTTTIKPRNKYPVAVSGHKVMNAPKEYYPVGYDKNYDDNFASKVDLPPTNFHCGDQKHFPGLYGDEDLGCMVFHVCALTDDGLIMKSFLCPESTLFDQTILKCNWWFYVECKSSRQLYDSNLPVSKSYQLMKALSFFSKYKNNQTGGDDTPAGVDLEALKNSVSSESV